MSESGCIALNTSTRQLTNNELPNREEYDCVLPQKIKALTQSSQNIYMGIFIAISLVAIAGNCAVIYIIPKRKYRYVQKNCIISLAVSDLLTTVVVAMNNLETFSHELLIWTLGSFLCSIIPMFQMVGAMATSTALMFIAMDRYRNVVNALSKRWNPSPTVCLSITLFLWVVIMAVSYPMYDFFKEAPIRLVYFDQEKKEYYFVPAKVCISFDKDSMKIYYIVMVIIILLPLLVVFLWFYYKIAILVWKHRKPVSPFYKNESSADTSTSNSDVKNCKPKKQTRDVKVERKIRTFKIIVILMSVFIVCRLPYYAIYILRLSLSSDVYGLWTWHLVYSFVALHILNCCLNPLLYTFLNPTYTFWLRVQKGVKDFTWEICCCCLSKGEFEEFEKQKPPFVVEHYHKRSSKVKFEENVKEVTY